MTTNEPPSGELFSRLYVDRSALLSDSKVARRRFAAYVNRDHDDKAGGLAEYLRVEGGLVVPHHGRYGFEEFFTAISLPELLDTITLVWRFLGVIDRQELRRNRHFQQSAPRWLAFARRVMAEENVGYRLDDAAGLHYRVDEEFETNRTSVLRCLDAPRYAAVRTAFELAHQHLEPTRRDAKAAVRSMFEALEILSRLMVSARNLHKKLVENSLKQLALETVAGDPTAMAAVEHLSIGFSHWVEALHVYRHGQGVTEPIEPPLDLAVYILSSGATYLRWLVSIDVAVTAMRLNDPITEATDATA